MEIKYFESLPKISPFAPEWFYQFGEDKIDTVDFDKIAKIILKNEQLIVNQLDPFKDSVVDAYTGLGEDSLTSRWGQYNLLSWDYSEIRKLGSEIFLKYLTFMDAVKVNRSKVYIQCWANVLRAGQEIKPHIHSVSPYCYLGGHITVQCENTSTVYINPINQINDPELYESKNEVGKITFFQQNIPHYTTIHSGKKERISIAFDIAMEEGIDFNKPASKHMILLDEIIEGEY